MAIRVAMLTCSTEPTLIDEERACFAELRAEGIEPHAVIWDADGWDLADYDGYIIRSCWDYHLKPTQFAAFLDKLETARVAVANPAPICRWNLDKHYVLELGAKGIAIPPSVVVERGAHPRLDELRSFDEAVVKPTISASAYQTWRTRFSTANADQERFDAMTGRGAVLVQQFIPEIVDGEISLVYFNRTFSHAVLKVPRPGDFRSQNDFGATREPIEVPGALLEFANRVLAEVNGPLLYARIDVVPTSKGPLLMELELIDPMLFLAFHGQAPRRWARAVAQNFTPVAPR